MPIKKIKQLMDEAEIKNTIAKMVDEILTIYSNDLARIVLVGVKTRGMPIAQIVSKIIKEKTDIVVPVVILDIKIYNDDLSFAANGQAITRQPDSSVDLSGKILIVCDDVAWTLATNAVVYKILITHQPAEIKFAVLVNRFEHHAPDKRQYAPSFVGLKQSTTSQQVVKVCFVETNDGETSVWLCEKEKTTNG